MVGPSLPFRLRNSGIFHDSDLSFFLFLFFPLLIYFFWNELGFRGQNSLIFSINSFSQWAAGFATFWYPGGSKNSRATLLPWHAYFGFYIYALAIATATTGILEKATFLQTNGVISRFSMEAFLVNSLGVLIVVLGGFVALAVVTDEHS